MRSGVLLSAARRKRNAVRNEAEKVFAGARKSAALRACLLEFFEVRRYLRERVRSFKGRNAYSRLADDGSRGANRRACGRRACRRSRKIRRIRYGKNPSREKYPRCCGRNYVDPRSIGRRIRDHRHRSAHGGRLSGGYRTENRKKLALFRRFRARDFGGFDRSFQGVYAGSLR